MGMGIRLGCAGRRAACVLIGVSLAIGTAGCKEITGIGASPSVSSSATGAALVATASAAAKQASDGSFVGSLIGSSTGSKHRRKHKPTRPVSPTAPATQPSTVPPTTVTPTQDPVTTPPAPVTSAPATDPTTPVADPTTPTQTPSPPSTGPIVFTANCAARASTNASGCGSWDAGPSSGQAPGFISGQQSSPNLLDVNQDPWSGSQGAQVLKASSFQAWSVTATDSDPSDSPGEVLTYPDASFNYYQLGGTVPAQYDLNNITSLTSDFAESMPELSDVNAEAAYDMWLNSWQTEVMVWVDTSPGKDRNLADSGDTEVGTYTYDGQNFSLWRNGSGITGFYIFLLDHSETSGTVNLKAMLETLVSLSYIPATSPLTEIPFGWEISDTGGKPATFSLSKFDVNVQG
jgi:hypothetical protein